jgi:hypothetical protein
MDMLPLLKSQRLRFLLFAIAIICALIWTAYMTSYRYVTALDSADWSSAQANIVRLGAVQDPVALNDLLPVDNAAFSAYELSQHLSAEKWAAVKSAAEKSIARSPLNSRMWLVLAIAEVARHSATESAVAALKMSYFTTPNDVTITEPRLALSLQLGALSDPELTAAVRRDIRNLFFGPRKLRIILTKIYCRALPAGRAVIDDLARELERALAETRNRAC